MDVMEEFDDALDDAKGTEMLTHAEEFVLSIAEPEKDCDCCGMSMGCGCPCPEEIQDPSAVNIPDSMYDDHRINMEAYRLSKLLPEIVVDLDFENIDFTGMTEDEIEKEFLIPAMEKAYADLIKEDPSLAGTLPALPTQLQEAVDAVMVMVDKQEERREKGAMKGESTTVDVEVGKAIVTQSVYHEILEFTKVTPGVFMYVDSVCKENGSCERYGETWD